MRNYTKQQQSTLRSQIEYLANYIIHAEDDFDIDVTEFERKLERIEELTSYYDYNTIDDQIVYNNDCPKAFSVMKFYIKNVEEQIDREIDAI